VVISQQEQMAYCGERVGYLEETFDLRQVGMVCPLEQYQQFVADTDQSRFTPDRISRQLVQ
jgi:hypothetical protein